MMFKFFICLLHITLLTNIQAKSLDSTVEPETILWKKKGFSCPDPEPDETPCNENDPPDPPQPPEVHLLSRISQYNYTREYQKNVKR